MRKSITLLCASASLIAGCTGKNLQPIGHPEIAGRTTGCLAATVSADQLEQSRLSVTWYECQLNVRALSAMNKSKAIENGREWRDIPLLGAAASIAGILFLGKKDANGVLEKGEQDTISGIGFGAAVFSTFANYLSPDTARRLLRQSARGHFCMAGQSRMLLNVWPEVTAKRAEHTELRKELAVLDGLLSKAPAGTTQLAELRAIRDAGYAADQLYQRQIDALTNAEVYLGESTFDFGMDLMTQADRVSVDTTAMVRSITEQTTSAVRFEQAKGSVSTPVAAALIDQAKPGIAALGLTTEEKKHVNSLFEQALEVARLTGQLTRGLPNVEALVLGFDTCATTALAGGDPRAARIQRLPGTN